MVIPGRCEASNPESRTSPVRNCAPAVWSFGPSRNDGTTSQPALQRIADLIQHLGILNGRRHGPGVAVGDLLGSGTISGPEKDQRGSLLEISWNGTEPVELAAGVKRTFLEDGDSLVMRGWCQGDGYRVGFGEVEGTILAAG